MKRLGWLACVLSIAVGAGACNRGADDRDDNGTPRTDTGISGSVGTAGDTTTSQDSGPVAQQPGTDARDERGDGDQQARADLPDTASWLPLAGIIGLLSMGGAFGIRLLRRE